MGKMCIRERAGVLSRSSGRTRNEISDFQYFKVKCTSVVGKWNRNIYRTLQHPQLVVRIFDAGVVRILTASLGFGFAYPPSPSLIPGNDIYPAAVKPQWHLKRLNSCSGVI